MKDPLNKTKIVVRNLPPSISQSAIKEQIDSRFSDRYKWFSFNAGKISHKNQRYSRVYIDFHSPEDVIEFAEFFAGRTFVNEKGSQYKALVEYAPSQSVPKLSSKKDGREGTILKDPDYLEFLEAVSKIENLPSAEIQLERKESEKTGGHESVIVTPLMDFIRQKRAAKNGSQRISVSGRLSRRAREAVTIGPSSSKRDSEKRRGSTSMYVLRDSAKASGERKGKTAYTILSRKEDQQSHSASKTEILEAGNKVNKAADGSNETTSPASGSVEISEKRAILKGKEKEVPYILSSSNTTASVRSIPNMTYRQRQQQEASGRTIRTILSNNNKVDQQTQEVNSEKDKRPPRPPNPHIKSISSVPYNDGKGYTDGSVSVSRNRNDKQIVGDDAPVSRGEIRSILPNSNRYAESKGGRASYTHVEKGAVRHVGSRGKEGDKISNYSEGKQSKKGVSANYGAYEKQMWVQKPASGS